MNYFNKMMVDAFGIITKRKVPWPDDMTFEQKVSLHEKEIEYWRESGDYEKCVVVALPIKPDRRGLAAIIPITVSERHDVRTQT